MRISLTSVFVDDQDKALAFYTDVLGFVKKIDMPAGRIPLTSFAVDDVQAEYDRLTDAGVTFRMPPTETGAGTIAMFDDTCGNYIQIYQV